MSRRAWTVGLVAGAVLLAGAGAVAFTRTRAGCGAEVVSLPASRSSSPFLDARERAEQPDHDRDTLVRTLARDPAPVGEVLGAVGYHYEQWAQVSSYDEGIGVRTRDNPDFTMLDDRTLDPRWSVRIGTRRSAYDAGAGRYLVATLPGRSAPDLVSLDARTGRRRWCHHLGGGPVTGDAPFATQILAGGDVVVLGPGTGSRERLARVDGRKGLVWRRTLDADSGDFVGSMGPDSLLLGGREQFRLLDPAAVAERPAGAALVLVSAADGHTIWTRREPAGADLHVLGTDSGTAVVTEWSSRTRTARLAAIDQHGTTRWSVVPARGASFDATLRSGRVLVRAGTHWSAYDVQHGHRLWARVVPDRPQFLPYGFELDSIPLLDDDHALVGGTTALHTLDLRTGALSSAALPTDGINTTYWPYQVAVSPGLIAVATNTGAVVVRRE